MLAGGVEVVPGFDELGVVAFTTTRQQGSFALQSAEPAATVFQRWQALSATLLPHAPRLASAHQVHGDRVIVHSDSWTGWLRAPEGDGHLALAPGTGMSVTVADCVPVFLAHPRGATAVVHSGWKGTVAAIAARAVSMLAEAGFPAGEVSVHCGPSICGNCYEVSPDVFARLTRRTVAAPTPVDLRDLIAGQVAALGVRQISISPWCTRCHNGRFFSHRCGDDGRQLGVIAARTRR